MPSEKLSEFQADIIRIDADLRCATITGDRQILEDGISDEFIYVHSGAAVVDTKQTWIDQILQTDELYRDKEYFDVTVKSCGDLVLLSGFIKDSYNTQKYNGIPPFAYYHQLRIYRLEAGGWKLFNQHTTWAVKTKAQSHELLNVFYQKFWIGNEDF